MKAVRTARPSSSRRKKRLESRGRAERPALIFLFPIPLIKCSRGPSLLDGQRPDVPTGLKSARQLMAAAPRAAFDDDEGSEDGEAVEFEEEEAA